MPASLYLALFVLAMLAFGGDAAAQSAPDKEVVRAVLIRDLMRIHHWNPFDAFDAEGEKGNPTSFAYAAVNLDGDTDLEVVAYIAGNFWCGTGGCHTKILDVGSCGLSIFAGFPASRAPVRVLETSTNGWRDLSVFVVGGGIMDGCDATARFTGEDYHIEWDGRPPASGRIILPKGVKLEPLLKPGATPPPLRGGSLDCPVS